MYRARITSDFFLAEYKVPIGEIIMESVTASHVLVLRAGEVEQYTPRPNPPIEKGSKVLIVRPGGIGDLLFITPIIAKLHEMGAFVTVSTHVRFAPILHGQSCELVPYPLTEEEVDSYDVRIFLENAVEDSPSGNIVDVFAAKAGVDISDKRCRYAVTPDEKAVAISTLRMMSDGSRKRIAVAPHATANCRTYPAQMMMAVASRLVILGYEVLLFGSPNSIELPDHSPFTNLTKLGLSIRESAALLAECDVCLGNDSMAVHLAGALNIPTVALYGPFHWKERTSYAPSIRAIQGVAPCSPCHHHSRSEPWPIGMPCYAAKQCVALASIPPDKVVAMVEKAIARR